MPLYAVGDIVVVPFPFSAEPDQAKRRPAVVLATWQATRGGHVHQDYLLALITTQGIRDPYRITLTPSDVVGFNLPPSPAQSYVRPSYLFSADHNRIVSKAGKLSPQMLDRVLLTLHQMLAPIGTPSVASLQERIEALQAELTTLRAEPDTDSSPQETG